MKGVFVILDGIGDLPCRRFNGKTPLEAARTPCLDFLATRGKMGYMYPIRPNYSPGSDEAIVSIFGNDLKDSSRGQLEARGAGIKIRQGDIALRVNFATIDTIEKGNVVDRRAGRTLTTREAKALAKSINKINFSHDFEFVATNQHRAALVIRGDFSSKVAGDDITYRKGYSKEIKKIVPCKALIRDVKAKYTAEVLNEFLKLAYEVLRNHPVNLKRKAKGLLPANYLLIRGPGVEKPKLKQYRNWVSANYMPLEIGFSELLGMKNFSFRYPKLRGLDAYKTLWRGLRKGSRHAMKVISKNLKKADYCYVHIKETDLPGHDNKPFEKKKMIEYVDKTLFRYLTRVAPMNKIRVVVTGDHSTPCKLKSHSADPVPVLLYDGSLPKTKRHFNESEARIGELGRIMGKDLFRKVRFVK